MNVDTYEPDTFDLRALENLYARLSSEGGMNVAELQAELTSLFARARALSDINDYRLSRGRWKKLSDEISPVSRFLRWRGVKSGVIRFPLDSNVPDCWLWPGGTEEPSGIEVTIAQGRGRYHLAKELVETGLGRGFIGVPDDAPEESFRKTMSRQREMYTADQALTTTENELLRSLAKKSSSKYAGMDLVIQTSLTALSADRRNPIIGPLERAATQLPFRHVFVIGDSTETPLGFRIK